MEGGEGRVPLRGWMERGLVNGRGWTDEKTLIKGAGWMEVPDWRVAGRLTGGVWVEGSGWMEGWMG